MRHRLLGLHAVRYMGNLHLDEQQEQGQRAATAARKMAPIRLMGIPTCAYPSVVSSVIITIKPTSSM